MPMITYPLNNVEYTAEDAELYNSTRTSGVYSGNDFSWTLTGEDNNITVGAGLAWIRNAEFSGKVVAHKESETFNFGVAPQTNGRMDVFAIQFNSVANATSLIIKKGVENDSYEIPERSTENGLYELYLFAVRRTPSAAYITDGDILDLRDNETYCGYMHESIKEGYAPSLMEHNKGEDFRFWVGTEEEYEASKDNLPPNTFCLTTGGPVYLRQWANVDDITSPGWYRFSGGITAGGVSANYAYMRVDSYNNKHATQTLYLVASGSRYTLVRHLITGVWDKEWSWVTSPAKSETIYKTNELFNNNPVYKLYIAVNENMTSTKSFTFSSLGLSSSLNVIGIDATYYAATQWHDIRKVGEVVVDTANKVVNINVGNTTVGKVIATIRFCYE